MEQRFVYNGCASKSKICYDAMEGAKQNITREQNMRQVSSIRRRRATCEDVEHEQRTTERGTIKRKRERVGGRMNEQEGDRRRMNGKEEDP